MKKHLIIIPAIVLLAASCSKSNNNNTSSNNPPPTSQQSGPKISDQEYANVAYLIDPSNQSTLSQKALTGFEVTSQSLPNGNTQIHLHALKSGYIDQTYELKPTERLYFIEKNLNDDSDQDKDDKFPQDDSAVVVDQNGFIVQTTEAPTSTPATSGVSIAKLSPASAKTGATVTITGQGFAKTGNHIMFGDSGGRHHPDGTSDNTITTADSQDGTTLTFTVPSSGPSGVLCDSSNHCIGVTAIRLLPGSFNVVVANSNGTSTPVKFTVTQ